MQGPPVSYQQTFLCISFWIRITVNKIFGLCFWRSEKQKSDETSRLSLIATFETEHKSQSEFDLNQQQFSSQNNSYLVSFIFFSQSIYYILTLNFKGSLLFREHKIRVAPYVIQSMIDPPLPMLFGTAVDFRNVQNSSIVECDSKILDLCFHKITWFKALYKIKVKRRFFG